MIFNSVAYVIFLPLVVTTYYFLSQKWRQYLLLSASLFFYSFWSLHRGGSWPQRLRNLFITDGLLLITIVVDFSVARWLAREKRNSRRRWILAISSPLIEIDPRAPGESDPGEDHRS